MLQGPSEFKVGGRLINWERWNDLAKITVPTLTIGAKYDTMNPAEMEEMSKLVKMELTSTTPMEVIVLCGMTRRLILKV